jgi:GNAT superfamily N-acetyltransferase
MIRKTVKKDLPQCVDFLHRDEFEFTEGGYPDINFLEAYLDDIFYVYEYEENNIIGLIFGERLKNEGILLHCIVVKDRGQGIGSAFLKNFEEEMKRIGIKWIILSSNVGALKFYEKNGYFLGKMLFECFKEL